MSVKSSSRWLFGFGAAVLVLVLVAVVLVLTMTGESDRNLLPEGTPGGVVQRYFRAIEADDYWQAYNYLSPSALDEESRYNTYEKWIQAYLERRQTNAWKATLGEPSVSENTSVVPVTIDIFKPNIPFEDPVRTRRYTFTLEKKDDVWSITSPVYPLYLY